MERSELIDRTIESVLKSKKYKYIYEPTVRRTVEKFVDRYSPKELEKNVKRELHRIWGSFLSRPDFDKLFKKVRDRVDSGEDELRVINDLLLLQSSTKERREILDSFYSEIFKITGVPNRITEYGCGINALTYPWINNNIEYIGYDVDRELVEFINSFYNFLGFNDRAEVRLGDVLLMDFKDSDITFLLKLLPLLEKQELRILDSISSEYIVVSYPTESISGKDVGMVDNYRDSFNSLVKDKGWDIDELLFDKELVFVVGKGGKSL
jgi:16S rRNA (guanine(1405)-N(7))-methyltransferase